MQPPDDRNRPSFDDDAPLDEVPLDEPSLNDAVQASDDDNYDDLPVYRASANDIYFGLALAAAVSVGTMPLTGTDADLRYTVTWGMLILFSVLAWLFGDFPRIDREAPEDVAWGAMFGVIIGIPLLAFGSGALDDITTRAFPEMGTGTVLAYLAFIMPMGESLFFRGLLQESNPFWQVALLASGWNLLLFFPLINAGPFPLILGIILVMVNMLYGYVRTRNGLAAAWICQVTANLILLFFPFI